MSGLAAMIAKQKLAAAAKESPVETQTPAPVADSPADGGATPAPAPKLKFGIKKPTANEEGRLHKVEPAKASPEPAGELTPGTDLVVQGGVMSLDDISDSTDEGKTPRAEFAFDDEIPATAPERELPEGLDASQLSFVTSLNSIYEIMHDPELFGGMIRTIMAELQESPANMSLMADQDVHTMIRGLRSSMGLAKIKKAEKSTKTRASKKTVAPTAIASTLEGMFNADEW